MESANLIKLAATSSILLLVFALGLRATVADTTAMFRHAFRPPHHLLRAVCAMFVVVPLVAITMGMLTGVPLAVRVAVLTMALAPVPPILPGKQLRFGGRPDYVFSLLVATAIAAVVIVPLGLELYGLIFHRHVRPDPAGVMKIIGITVLLPLLVGIALRSFSPHTAERFAPWASRLGTALLVLVLIPVFWVAWPAMASLIGDGTLATITIAVMAGIAAGHWLGGPDPDERTSLAVATAMRHPGIALAIANLNTPEVQNVQAAVLLYLLIAVVATSVYGIRRKKQRHLHAA